MSSSAIPVGTVTNTANAATTISVTMPSGIVSGEVLMMVVVKDLTGIPNTPSGWSLLKTTVSSANQGTSSNGLMLAWREADGSEGASVSVTWTGAANAACAAWRVTGCRATKVGGHFVDRHLFQQLMTGASVSTTFSVAGAPHYCGSYNQYLAIFVVYSVNTTLNETLTSPSVDLTQMVNLSQGLGALYIGYEQVDYVATPGRSTAYQVTESATPTRSFGFLLTLIDPDSPISVSRRFTDAIQS